MADEIQKEKKRINRKMSIALGIFVIASLSLGSYICLSGEQGGIHLPLVNQESRTGGMPFMEPPSQKQDTEEKNETAVKQDGKSASRIENPDVIRLSGRDFNLFDSDILLPLDTETWDRYSVPGSDKGLYDGIEEFYVKGESPQNWTQKFTLHHVQAADVDCVGMAEKLVNGLIANSVGTSELDGQQFKPENISVNYVKKDADNALFFWGKKNVDGVPDETQFVRLFKTPYSSKMYLVTYTLKMDIGDFSDDDAAKYMRTLNSIQELKKKE